MSLDYLCPNFSDNLADRQIWESWPIWLVKNYGKLAPPAQVPEPSRPSFSDVKWLTYSFVPVGTTSYRKRHKSGLKPRPPALQADALEPMHHGIVWSDF